MASSSKANTFKIPALHGSYRKEFSLSTEAGSDGKIALKFDGSAGLNLIVGYFSKGINDSNEDSVYEVVFGAWGKWAVLLRKAGQAIAVAEVDGEFNSAEQATGSEADSQPFMATPGSFWVVLGKDGSLAAGKSSVIGEGTLLTFPASEEVGDKVKDLENLCAFFSTGDDPITISNATLQFWNGEISNPSMEVNMMFEASSGTPGEEGMTDELVEQQRKAQQRAVRFGIECKVPDQKKIFAWTEYKKMMKMRERKQNPDADLGLGFDLTSPEEREKAKRRKERFGIFEEKEDIDEKEEEIKKAKRAARFGIPVVSKKPIWQQLKLRVKHIYRKDPLRADPPPESQAKRCPDKVHIHSLDAAFKQIRSRDILVHFSKYGANYVEWLTDVSCNVCLPNESSAARFIEEQSADLPPPPKGKESPDMETSEEKSKEEVVDLVGLGWRLGKSKLRKVRSDRWGREGTEVRYIMRIANVTDILLERPPPKRPLRETSQTQTQKQQQETQDSLQKDYGIEEEDDLAKALTSPRRKRQRKERKDEEQVFDPSSEPPAPINGDLKGLARVEANDDGCLFTKRNLLPTTSLFGQKISNNMDAQAVLEKFSSGMNGATVDRIQPNTAPVEMETDENTPQAKSNVAGSTTEDVPSNEKIEPENGSSKEIGEEMET